MLIALPIVSGAELCHKAFTHIAATLQAARRLLCCVEQGQIEAKWITSIGLEQSDTSSSEAIKIMSFWNTCFNGFGCSPLVDGGCGGGGLNIEGV